MGASDQYTNELHKQLAYYAAWVPGTPLELGTIGSLFGSRFVPRDKLSNFDVSFETRTDQSSDIIEYSTKGGVDVAIKAEGEASTAMPSVPQARAGMKLTFTGQNAIWFAATGCTVDTITDQLQMAERIKALYRKHEWEADWVVVTHLVRASEATILISATRGGTVELELAVDGSVAGSKAKASARAKLAAETSMQTKIVAQSGLTPLFYLSKLSDGWRQWLLGTDPEFGVKEKGIGAPPAATGPEPEALERIA